jgi:hypothetical protein
MPSMTDAVAAGFALVGEEHLLTSLLSSPGTIRKLYVEKGADVSDIETDLNLALALGIGFSLLLAWMFKSKFTAWVGVAFGLLLYVVYKERANL